MKEGEEVEIIQKIEKGERGDVLSIVTDLHKIKFSPEKCPTEGSYLQEGDAVKIDFKESSNPLISITKPGVWNPGYKEFLSAGCITPAQ